MEKRDFSIDVLRTVGLLGIILAHVNAPDFILNLRSFDVPLMVVISGLLFGIKETNNSALFSFSYVKKRFVRLVLPTWIFLSFYFVFQLGLHLLFPYKPLPDKSTMLSAFLLFEGFGYVWIIRIFFIVAIFGAPFVNAISRIRYPYIIFISIYVCYEIVVCLASEIDYGGKYYVNRLLFYSIGYILFFAYGAFYDMFKGSIKYSIIILSFIGIILIETISYYQSGNLVNILTYKYPPHYLYILYALFSITVLLNLAPLLKGKRNKLVSFIGSSTMWIYLWHILFINYIHIQSFAAKFIVVLALSMVVTYLQQKVILVIIGRYSLKDERKKLIKTIFLG
mgnify:CR=1 FL=1